MDDLGLPLGILGIIIATFVLAAVAAAETALERASDVRIQALANRGNLKARRIASKVQEPRAFLGPLTAARVLCAAAIVAVSAYLGAGAFGPLRGALAIGACGGAFVAVIEMTVGLVAARQPEYAAIQLSGIVRLTGPIFAIPAFLLGLPSRLVARSIQAVTRDTETDILALVEREEAAGGVEEQERRMIRGVIALEDKSAREIMVPRIDMVAADVEEGVEDLARLVNESGVSRVPVYRDNIDDIAGIVYAKDLLRVVYAGGREKKIPDLMRVATFIPESKRLDELLTEMKASRTHIAIVVDEYGGTAGLVTIEDLLEEIVGEIQDEYDETPPQTEVISDDEVIMDGRLDTDILKDLFGYDAESEDFDTVGGLVMNLLGRLPQVGDEVETERLRLKVVSMAGRRIKRLRVTRVHHDHGDESDDR